MNIGLYWRQFGVRKTNFDLKVIRDWAAFNNLMLPLCYWRGECIINVIKFIKLTTEQLWGECGGGERREGREGRWGKGRKEEERRVEETEEEKRGGKERKGNERGEFLRFSPLPSPSLPFHFLLFPPLSFLPLSSPVPLLVEYFIVFCDHLVVFASIVNQMKFSWAITMFFFFFWWCFWALSRKNEYWSILETIWSKENEFWSKGHQRLSCFQQFDVTIVLLTSRLHYKCCQFHFTFFDTKAWL